MNRLTLDVFWQFWLFSIRVWQCSDTQCAHSIVNENVKAIYAIWIMIMHPFSFEIILNSFRQYIYIGLKQFCFRLNRLNTRWMNLLEPIKIERTWLQKRIRSKNTQKKDQRVNDKHQRKFSLSLPLSLGVNGPKLSPI